MVTQLYFDGSVWGTHKGYQRVITYDVDYHVKHPHCDKMMRFPTYTKAWTFCSEYAVDPRTVEIKVFAVGEYGDKQYLDALVTEPEAVTA